MLNFLSRRIENPCSISVHRFTFTLAAIHQSHLRSELTSRATFLVVRTPESLENDPGDVSEYGPSTVTAAIGGRNQRRLGKRTALSSK
jgi:hypothetical protein